ncbi:MAG: hypothetical protein HYZ14_11450 [Bacteroidetes bacterium]|nr:hypothetical protein [Bacteroidota bacterium]
MLKLIFPFFVFVCLSVTGQTEHVAALPELYFGHLKDRAFVSLSFRQKFPGHVRLINENGDSSQNYTILSGMVEQTETGTKGQITAGGYLSDEAKFVISNAKPGLLKISVYCKSVDLQHSFETSMQFIIGLPPVIQAAGIQNGDSLVGFDAVSKLKQVLVGFPDYPGLEDFFHISGGTLNVGSISESGKILEDGLLDETALRLLKNCSGQVILITVFWSDSTGVGRTSNFRFTVSSS